MSKKKYKSISEIFKALILQILVPTITNDSVLTIGHRALQLSQHSKYVKFLDCTKTKTRVLTPFLPQRKEQEAN